MNQQQSSSQLPRNKQESIRLQRALGPLLRQLAVFHLRKKSDFQAFIIGDKESYYRKMSRMRTYGDDLMINVLADILRIKVNVIKFTGRSIFTSRDKLVELPAMGRGDDYLQQEIKIYNTQKGCLYKHFHLQERDGGDLRTLGGGSCLFHAFAQQAGVWIGNLRESLQSNGLDGEYDSLFTGICEAYDVPVAPRVVVKRCCLFSCFKSMARSGEGSSLTAEMSDSNHYKSLN